MGKCSTSHHQQVGCARGKALAQCASSRSHPWHSSPSKRCADAAKTVDKKESRHRTPLGLVTLTSKGSSSPQHTRLHIAPTPLPRYPTDRQGKAFALPVSNLRVSNGRSSIFRHSWALQCRRQTRRRHEDTIELYPFRSMSPEDIYSEPPG